MKKRIYKKILKRCRNKLNNDKRRIYKNMPYNEVISILNGIEKKVWFIEQKKLCKIADQIIEKLKADGNW